MIWANSLKCQTEGNQRAECMSVALLLKRGFLFFIIPWPEDLKLPTHPSALKKLKVFDGVLEARFTPESNNYPRVLVSI